ncbi:E3 ubiquitin-protein ligase [Phytophthora cinnamomi]|uniref:E3 ubiquitin-protein ligase n=1 Tax=Phytophthora cinnamomi TaxID=4785 RepID=UPI0035593EF4|nr:E3 ubiquitin-protein ligase [Phytophthora cinnamomi]
MAALVLLAAAGGLGAVLGLLAMYLPQALFPLAVAFGLPVVMYAIISLVELIILGTKRDQTQNHQQRRRQAPRGVMQMSRALYEQLDGEMLQLLLSNRDFDSNDYERLMRLEALNERRHQGATPQQIQQLPIVAVTESMLQASENASCAICLGAFELDGRARMMPCFHRFHPECIDPWLQEKALCPICKFPAIA